MITRILYFAKANSEFAEHELDYIVFGRTNMEPGERIPVNPDEVEDYKWVGMEEMGDFLADRGVTPWFRLIQDNKMRGWWETVRNGQMPKGEEGKIERFDR